MESFDQSQPAVRYGCEQWLLRVQDLQKKVSGAEIFYRFKSPELLNVCVRYYQAVINLFIHRYEVEAADQERERLLGEVKEAVLKSGLIVGDDFEISPSALAIFRSPGKRRSANSGNAPIGFRPPGEQSKSAGNLIKDSDGKQV